jgi:transketolase
MAYVLYTEFLRHDPSWPDWPNRDRFVLSAGHGSALLYALLHLCGYDLSLQDLKAFRQWRSKTPGHPERGTTPGVEATTGPLGQGFANGVGMAIAERLLAARFNREDLILVDHRTFGIVSDGDLMEGIAYEAASLAAHLELGKLVYLYDDNGICLDGPTDDTYSADRTVAALAALGWHIENVADGNDLDAIRLAVSAALAQQRRPSLVRVRTRIGYGSPKEGSSGVHGTALSLDEVRATKQALGDIPLEPFMIPELVYERYRERMIDRRSSVRQWRAVAARYADTHPEDWRAWEASLAGDESAMASVFVLGSTQGDPEPVRLSSSIALGRAAEHAPSLVVGAADLASSTLVRLVDDRPVRASDFAHRTIAYGVREHAMAGIANGLAQHGGVRPVVSTYLMFATYMMNSIRMAALQQLPVIYVFSHDSLAVGEDGPTHQPIEVLPALRAIPGLWVFRPADAFETDVSWQVALQRLEGPCAFSVSRMPLPQLGLTRDNSAAAKGAYVLRPEPLGTPPAVVLLATGSEVSIVMGAAQQLNDHGVPARVVSVPCLESFAAQPASYRREVLPAGVPRIAVEAAHPMSWWRIVGGNGDVIGTESFGASAPPDVLFEAFGLTPGAVAARTLAFLDGKSRGVTHTGPAD